MLIVSVKQKWNELYVYVEKNAVSIKKKKKEENTFCFGE